MVKEGAAEREAVKTVRFTTPNSPFAFQYSQVTSFPFPHFPVFPL